jgi:hypothetical protein
MKTLLRSFEGDIGLVDTVRRRERRDAKYVTSNPAGAIGCHQLSRSYWLP